MSIDNRLKNYSGAVRGLRRAPNRRKWLDGPFKLALSLEKDPRLRARLQSIYDEELQQPA